MPSKPIAKGNPKVAQISLADFTAHQKSSNGNFDNDDEQSYRSARSGLSGNWVDEEQKYAGTTDQMS